MSMTAWGNREEVALDHGLGMAYLETEATV